MTRRGTFSIFRAHTKRAMIFIRTQAALPPSRRTYYF